MGPGSRRGWLRALPLAALGAVTSAPLAALLGASFSSVAEAHPAEAEGGFERGIFWRVTPAGRGAKAGAAASHLYGTLHIDDEASKAFAAPVRTALKAARVFMPELRSDAASAQTFMAAAQLPASESLRALVGEEGFERVAGALARHYGVPPRTADRLRPWAAFLQLSQPTQPPGETVDAALERLALRLGRPVEPLEEMQAQIDALEAIAPASQLALLDAQARHHAEVTGGLGVLRALYLAENLAGLRRQERTLGDLEPSLQPDLDELIEQLVHRRSEGMAARLAGPLKTGGVFVAVGALHLHGERGLPALLARAGHRVERVALRPRRP